MSGGQWGAWNAAYGPRGDDGRPVPLWDPRTGVINRAAVAHWKAYDLRQVLEQNWEELGPRLQGKIHIWVGDADDCFLNNAKCGVACKRQRIPGDAASLAFDSVEGCSFRPERASSRKRRMM
jgi:hypothetical protein